MFPIGICTYFVHLPEALSLGYDYAELPLRDLAALPESDFQEFPSPARTSALRRCTAIWPTPSGGRAGWA